MLIDEASRNTIDEQIKAAYSPTKEYINSDSQNISITTKNMKH